MSDRLGRSTVVIGGMTVLSRVSGLLRDKCIAFVFGAGALTDAFFVAYRIPDLLRGLLAEGSLSAAFIPLFTREEKERGKDAAFVLGSAALTVMAMVLVAVTLLGMLCAPWLVRLFTFEFFPPCAPNFPLTVSLTRALFPFIFFIGLAALVMGMLNAQRKFALPAFAPVMLNLAMIAGALWLAPAFGSDPSVQIHALAVGVLLGGLLQLLVQLPALYRLGFRFRPVLRHPALKKMFTLMLPGTVGLMMAEVGLLVDTVLAWNLGEGAVSSLYWGNRLMQLPLGVFGVAIATAMLPVLSGHSAAHRLDEFKRTLGDGVRLMLAILVPAAVGLIVLARPVIRVLLEGGRFTGSDTHDAALATVCFTLGLCSFAGVKIFAQAFYALQDTRTPVKIAIAALFLNIALNLLLMVPLSFAGLALATALAVTFNWLALVVLLRRRLGTLGGREIFSAALRVLIAALLMGGGLMLLLQAADPAAMTSLPLAAFWLALHIALGTVVYVAVAHLLRVPEVSGALHKALGFLVPR